MRRFHFTVYIEIAISLAMMVAGILANYSFAELEAVEIPGTVMYLPIAGFVSFCVLMLCGVPRLGAAVAAATGLIAGGIFALGVYNYPMVEVMNNLNILEIPYMVEMIVCAGILIGGGLLSNLFAWIPMVKNDI